jgi:hypothetical protein
VNRRDFLKGVVAAALATQVSSKAVAAVLENPRFQVKGLLNPSIRDVGNGWFHVSGQVASGFSVPFDLGDAAREALSDPRNTLEFGFHIKAPDGVDLLEDGVAADFDPFLAVQMLQLQLMNTPTHYIPTTTVTPHKPETARTNLVTYSDDTRQWARGQTYYEGE